MALVSLAVLNGANYPLENVVVTGSPTYGDAVNVLNGTYEAGACTGYPPENSVLLNTVFGEANEYTGNRTDCPETLALLGTQYGANGISLYGTYSCDTGDPGDPEWIGK